MSNLYNIQQSLLTIFNEIEDNEGDITPEIEEQLIITQEAFKDKVKSYCEVIKMLQYDVANIKEEKARLDSLKKSKEATIERLKRIVIEAIDKFGDTTKNGGKYVDYGTGKVSVRNTETVELDEDNINKFVNRFISALSWYDMQNQLDDSIISSNDILEYANQFDDDSNNIAYTLEDLTKLDADIDVNVSLKTLLETENGFNLAKALIKFNNFKIKGTANKTDIKREVKDTHKLPVFAELVENKSLTIK